MKKKTFGRIAALGLAGLTAVPAISIVASADLRPTGTRSAEEKDSLGNTTIPSLPYVSGTTYKLEWELEVRSHSYSLSADKNTLDAETVVMSATTIGDSTYPLKDTKYYAYSVNATTVPTVLKDLVNQKNKTYEATKSKYDEYAWHEKTVNTEQRAQFKRADGTFIYYKAVKVGETDVWGYYDSDDAAVTDVQDTTPTDTATEYIWIKQPTPVSISSMNNLIAELHTDLININPTTNEVTAASATDADYRISKTGSTNNSTSTSTGSYSQYVIPANTRWASTKSYYSYDMATWYPNTTAFYYAVGEYPNSSNSYSKTPSPAYSSAYCYFDPVNGNYHTSSNGYDYAVYVGSGVSTGSENYVYQSPTTKLYYLSWTAAKNATSGDLDPEPIKAIPTYAAFFSMSNGVFYSTYSDAYAASGNIASRVIAVNGAGYVSTNDYIDPFYYYYLMGGTRNNTSSKDTSSVKIGNKTGWTAVASSAKSAKSGSTLSVAMNGETVVPSTVLSSIKGRNVTVNFTLKNGVVYTINGSDVSSVKDIDIETIYNTKYIPSKLVSKAKSKNNGVSTSQLSIEGGSFGSSADVTVKFATKRAGCTARLYRYNSDRNSLSLVAKSTVNSNGKCTFGDVTKGGDYVIVLS